MHVDQLFHCSQTLTEGRPRALRFMEVAEIAEVCGLDPAHVERVIFSKLKNDGDAINAAMEEFLCSGTGAFVDGKHEHGWVELERKKDKSKKVSVI